MTAAVTNATLKRIFQFDGAKTMNKRWKISIILLSLALLCAALFTGMFWAVFGQVFQSGATAREFCLAWAASITPLLLLRRSACLWNLWVLLLFAAAAGGPLSLSWDTWLSRPLPSLLIAAACSLEIGRAHV